MNLGYNCHRNKSSLENLRRKSDHTYAKNSLFPNLFYSIFYNNKNKALANNYGSNKHIFSSYQDKNY